MGGRRESLEVRDGQISGCDILAGEKRRWNSPDGIADERCLGMGKTWFSEDRDGKIINMHRSGGVSDGKEDCCLGTLVGELRPILEHRGVLTVS